MKQQDGGLKSLAYANEGAPYRPPPPGPPRSLPPRSSRTTDFRLRISHAPTFDPPKARFSLPLPRAVARRAHLSLNKSLFLLNRFVPKLIILKLFCFFRCSGWESASSPTPFARKYVRLGDMFVENWLHRCLAEHHIQTCEPTLCFFSHKPVPCAHR